MAAGGLGRYLLRDPLYAHDCRTSAPVRFRRSIRQLLGIELPTFGIFLSIHLQRSVIAPLQVENAEAM